MAKTAAKTKPHPGATSSEATAVRLVREPRQERSRRTLARILDAAVYLLEHEGPGALTVTEITKRARTSVGSFYARFEGKDGLLRYMGERSLNEALAVWTKLGESVKVEGDLRTSVSEVVKRLGWLYLEGAGRVVVLLDGIEDAAPSRRRRLENQIAADLRELGIAPQVRSDLATRVLTGVLQDAALLALRRSSDGTEGSPPYPEPRTLLSELTELAVGYLGGEVQEPVVPVILEPSDVREAPPPPPEEPEVEKQPEERPEPRPGIDTGTLVEAAQSTGPAAPAAPPLAEPPVAPPAVSPEETESESAVESEEPPPEPEPDPFDVWG